MIDFVRRNDTNCPRAPGDAPCHAQYHYTDEPGFDELRRIGALRPENLVVRHRHIRLRRPLVWLTDDTDLDSPAVRTVARLGTQAKITVRLTVSTSSAQRSRPDPSCTGRRSSRRSSYR